MNDNCTVCGKTLKVKDGDGSLLAIKNQTFSFMNVLMTAHTTYEDGCVVEPFEWDICYRCACRIPGLLREKSATTDGES